MITDFVHLNWHFTNDSDYPAQAGLYLCLINPADISPNVELKTLFYDSDIGIFFEDEGEDLKYSCVVAWADPTRFSFTCDPEKYEGCDKDLCYTKTHNPFDHCCRHTTHLEYAKDYDFH